MTDALPLGTPVLVTGATGFTGRVLVRQLATDGADVRAIARPSSEVASVEGDTIRWIRGDVFDPATVRAAMKDVQYVFHVAAAYRQAAVADDYYRRVHVESTELLARAAVDAPGFRRFVHVSTVGVHGHIENPPGDESTPFAPGDAYQSTKAEAERWLADFADRTGLPYAIVRPCAIYGPGDTRLLKVFKMAARGVFPVLGSGRTLYQLIHVEDLANVLRLAAVHPAALGRAVIAGNPRPLPVVEMARVIGRALGRRVRVARLPATPVFLLADLCERVCRPLGIEPPLYRRRVAFYTKDRAFDTRRLREELGYDCRYSNEEGLSMTARWYVDQGWVRGAHA